MSPPKSKNRASILKKRRSSFDSPEPTATSTNKLPKKGILFSDKNTVKEFMQCDEKTTIWGNSYEMSIARSDGSSDSGSQTSKKLSCDFSCSTVQSNDIDDVDESEKENFINTRASEIHFEDSHKLSSLSSSASSSRGTSLENMTVEMHMDEKKRIRMYGFENLNFTNMQLDPKAEDNMIISPRKSNIPNGNTKFSLSYQENLLIEQAEPNYSDDFSIQLNYNEIKEIGKCRKTIRNVEDMNITSDNSAQNSSYNLRNKKKSSGESKLLPKVFKQPDVPKMMFPGHNLLANVSDINLDSPPMKPANLQNQKQDLNDFMDFLVTETPTKNLCHQMCMVKKRIITPLTSQEQPSTKIISSSATRQRVKEPLENTNLSCYILKDIGLDLDILPDHSLKEPQSDMHTSLSLEQQSQNRRTIVNYVDISTDENKTFSANTVRKSLFEVDGTISEDIKPQDLDISEINTGFNQKSMAQECSNVDDNANRSSYKSQTVFESDISLDDLVYEKFFLSSTKVNDVTDTTTELARKAARLLSNPMAGTASNSNSYNPDADISLNAPSKSPNFMSNTSRTSSRKTVFMQDMSLQEPSVLRSGENGTFKSCKSIENTCKHENAAIAFDMSGKNLTGGAQAAFYEHSESLQSISKKSGTSCRKTVFTQDMSLQEPSILESEEETASCQTNQNQSKHASTAIDIDISGIERTEGAQSSFYENSMEEEKKSTVPSKPFNLSSRGTIHYSNAIMETSTATFSKFAKPQSSKQRQTVYNNAHMDETNLDEETKGFLTNELQLELKTRNREESTALMQPLSTASIYDNERDHNCKVQEDLMDHHNQSHENFHRNRKTMNDEEEMDISSHARSLLDAKNVSETSVATITGDRKTRLTEPTNMNGCKTVYDFEIQEETLVELLPNVSKFEEGQNYHKTVSGKSSLNLSIPSSNMPSLSRIYTPPVDFQTIEQENGSTTEDRRFHLNRASLLRRSVFVPSNTSFPSFCQEPEKQISNELEGKRFLNITDAEFRSFIDDESNPCLSETGDTHRNQTPSTSNLNTSYQNALHDFINMTIMDSPLHTTVPLIPNLQIRERLATGNDSPPIDYCAQLDDLVAKLETNDKIQPRLPIDEYLEKLNIKPVTIKYMPQMEPTYLSKCFEAARIKAEKNRVARILAEKNNPQYPEIPSETFLIENLLKCMQDDRMEKQKKCRITITPVFPLKESFRYLLKNKFETDIHLSKFWTLDLSFGHLNHYKLLHKVMPGLKMNISVTNPPGSIDDSTIPILFKGFLLYKDPNYRQVQIERLDFLHNEFCLLIGTDNFLPMCPSSKHLFAFLELFHNNVMKAANLVTNFYKIVYTNDTFLERTPDHFRITSRVFLQEDIVDVMIAIQDSIGAVSINDIFIKGSCSFFYEIVPRSNIAAEKGLMLLEIVLSDPKQFIEDNTRRFEIE